MKNNSLSTILDLDRSRRSIGSTHPYQLCMQLESDLNGWLSHCVSQLFRSDLCIQRHPFIFRNLLWFLLQWHWVGRTTAKTTSRGAGLHLKSLKFWGFSFSMTSGNLSLPFSHNLFKWFCSYMCLPGCPATIHNKTTKDTSSLYYRDVSII